LGKAGTEIFLQMGLDSQISDLPVEANKRRWPADFLRAIEVGQRAGDV
jgi:hypothetical protein